MATYVLVHGAWHGGWCWARVAARLREAGHVVFTPTLSGVADRSHLAGHPINLSTHIEDVTSLLRWEGLSDVILVGHSYGGAVITGAAARMGSHIATLVYLDAFIPQDGQSMLDLMPEDRRIRFLSGLRADGRMIPPINAAHFNVNQADRAWVDAQCTPHPAGCFLEALRRGGEEASVRSHVYIQATDYPATPFRPYRDQCAANPAWQVSDIATGHDAMLDNPAALAALLLPLAPLPPTA